MDVDVHQARRMQAEYAGSSLYQSLRNSSVIAIYSEASFGGSNCVLQMDHGYSMEDYRRLKKDLQDRGFHVADDGQSVLISWGQ
jgi:hypothetical protein